MVIPSNTIREAEGVGGGRTLDKKYEIKIIGLLQVIN